MGLLPEHHVARLCDQPGSVSLGIPISPGHKSAGGEAVHQSSRARQRSLAFRAGAQARRAWDDPLYLPGSGRLRLAFRREAGSDHMEAQERDAIRSFRISPFGRCCLGTFQGRVRPTGIAGRSCRVREGFGPAPRQERQSRRDLQSRRLRRVTGCQRKRRGNCLMIPALS